MMSQSHCVLPKSFIAVAVGLLLSFGLGSNISHAGIVDSRTEYFVNGKVGEGREIVLGDAEEWIKPISGLEGRSAGGKVTMTPTQFEIKNDALRLNFSDDVGRGEMAIYGPTKNLKAFKDDHALVFSVAVHDRPTHGVNVAMDCGYPCRAEYNIGGILRAIKKDTWTAIPIPLSCFNSNNFSLGKISGFFMLSTSGSMEVSVSDIHLAPLPKGGMSCPSVEEHAGANTGELNPNFFYFVNGDLVGSRGITLGDPGKWGLSIDGLEGESATGKLKVRPVDFQQENDAIHLEWSRKDAKGELAIYGPVIDIEPYENLAALTFDVKVHNKPRESVKVGMDCGYPCRAEFEIGKTLRKLKKDTWTSFPIPLNCLESSNFDLSKINGVFLISTSGRLELSIANIRLEKLPEGANTCAD